MYVPGRRNKKNLDLEIKENFGLESSNFLTDVIHSSFEIFTSKSLT